MRVTRLIAGGVVLGLCLSLLAAPVGARPA